MAVKTKPVMMMMMMSHEKLHMSACGDDDMAENDDRGYLKCSI